MRTFQRLTHYLDIADTFKRIISPATGQFDKMADKVAFDLAGIYKMRHAKFFAPRLFAVIHINANDHPRANHAQTLNHIQPDTAKPEHNGNTARLGLGGVDHRANAGCDTAADIANLVKRRRRIYFGQRNFRQNGKIGKG